jgi:hypothetical protein
MVFNIKKFIKKSKLSMSFLFLFIIILLFILFCLFHFFKIYENFASSSTTTVFSYNYFKSISELKSNFGFQYSCDKQNNSYSKTIYITNNYGNGSTYNGTGDPNPCYFYIYPSDSTSLLTTVSTCNLPSYCAYSTSSACSTGIVNSDSRNCCSISGQNLTKLGSVAGLLQINLYSTDLPFDSPTGSTDPRTELRGLDAIPDNGSYYVVPTTGTPYYSYNNITTNATSTQVNRNYTFIFEQYIPINSSSFSPQFTYAFAQLFGGAGPNILLRAKSTYYQLLINKSSSTIKLYIPSSSSSAAVSDDVGKWVRWVIQFRLSNDSSGYVNVYRNNNITNVYGTNGDTNLGNLLQGSISSNSLYTYSGPICGGNGVNPAKTVTTTNNSDPNNSFSITTNCSSGESNTSYIKHGVYSHVDSTYTNIYSFTSYTRYMSLTYETVSGSVSSSPSNYSCAT